MKCLLFIFALLMAIPAHAQVTVTGETVAVDLPHDTITYSRDAVEIRDSMFALENIWLAFYLAGEEVDIPPLSESIIAERDSLIVVNEDLKAENDSLAKLYDNLAAAVREVIQ